MCILRFNIVYGQDESKSHKPTTPTSPTSVLQDAEHSASTRSESSSSTVWVSPSHLTTRHRKKEEKKETTRTYRETRCVICQNGYKNLRKILWTKEFQRTGTPPRVLLVNQLQSREQMWYWLGQAQY